ncbi:hypothetical protein H6P81_005214 [Aristolochia fimbriata]|uniref:Uncharacterized protein n=1 Tax=Aristolochia fimbriata TaxID=158543 RepID=A0AAV7ETT6_ARIFI|nr:hypothetical protein H6P81_005214 [Aristolochia fimbriata]
MDIYVYGTQAARSYEHNRRWSPLFETRYTRNEVRDHEMLRKVGTGTRAQVYCRGQKEPTENRQVLT